MNSYERKKVINLIRRGAEKDEDGFKKEAFEIAEYFADNGQEELAIFIKGLFAESNYFLT